MSYQTLPHTFSSSLIGRRYVVVLDASTSAFVPSLSCMMLPDRPCSNLIMDLAIFYPPTFAMAFEQPTPTTMRKGRMQGRLMRCVLKEFTHMSERSSQKKFLQMSSSTQPCRNSSDVWRCDAAQSPGCVCLGRRCGLIYCNTSKTCKPLSDSPPFLREFANPHIIHMFNVLIALK